MNTFPRIEMSALGPDFYDGAPVDLSTDSLDFIKSPTGFSAGPIGPRKLGANLITLSLIGVDLGFNDILGYPFSWGSDATETAGTSTYGHAMGSHTLGNGWRFEINIGTGPYAGRWPDKYLFKVWDVTWSVRQTGWLASISGDSDAEAVTEYIGPSDPTNSDLQNLVGHLTEVTFSSEVPGSVFTLDMVRDGGSMSNWAFMACALYLAPVSHTLGRGDRTARMSRVRV